MCVNDRKEKQVIMFFYMIQLYDFKAINLKLRVAVFSHKWQSKRVAEYPSAAVGIKELSLLFLAISNFS